MASERVISYAEAVREATDQEMERDPGVVVFGLGVDDPHLQYGTIKGLVDKYGPDRVFDTPISEDAMTGFAIGAGLAGIRPIHVHIRMDFLMLTMNQLVNYAAKARYMFGGAVSVPIVIRSVIGRSWGQGGQHSQGLQSMFMHVPGLRVVAPTTPHDAKATLLASIRDDNPVMFVEHRMLHGHRGHVPEGAEAGPIGRARVLLEGGDVTLVGVSHAIVECLRAAHALEQVGIRAEVIDPVWLAPLDDETIVRSARKTGNLLVVDSGWTTCGASAEIVARVVEATQDGERVRVGRMGFAPTTCPTTPSLEELFYPDAPRIAARAHAMLRPGAAEWTPSIDRATEIAEFKGPF